jgi:hypothetical protein
LERKADELQRKEQQMRDAQINSTYKFMDSSTILRLHDCVESKKELERKVVKDFKTPLHKMVGPGQLGLTAVP